MIYCVEDDESIRQIIVYALNNSGYQAVGFSDVLSMHLKLQEQLPQLILLDVMLPEVDGMTCLKQLKQDPRYQHIPVIMVTAKTSEYDTVEGLDLGADDYIKKPFGVMELLSRVKAVLRRSQSESTAILSFRDLKIDTKQHRVWIQGDEVRFTLKEYLLLLLFLQNQGRVFTRQQLFESVWQSDYYGESRTIDMHIKSLRTKLLEYGNYIKTIHQVGYMWEKL